MVARQRRRIPRAIPLKKLEGLELSRFTFRLSTPGRRKTRLPVETNGFILTAGRQSDSFYEEPRRFFTSKLCV